MSNNLIQIKRSTTTAVTNTTPSISSGELVFTSNGYILAIGDPANSANVISIGGARFPGTLTANQALVANSTSGIDKVIVANLVPTSIWANGAAGISGQVLASNSSGGVYWNTPLPSVVGSDTQVQFNDGGALGADSGLTFNKTSDTLSTNNVFATSVVNAATLSVGTSVVANSTRLVLGATVGLEANGSIGVAGQVLHSNGTTAYWSNTTADITEVVAGDGLTGGGTTGSVTVNVGSGNGISVSADAIRVQQANGIAVDAGGVRVDGGSTLTVNSSGAHVNTNLSITSITTSGGASINGNAKLGDTSSDVISLNGVVNTDIMPSANVTYNIGNNTVRWNEIHASNVHSVTGYFDGSVEISGDLIVTGNVTTVNVNSVVVSDPMIYLAGNNYSSDLVDIGLAANYYDGVAQRHTGFFRDATDGVWKLFANSTQELSGNNVVNTSASGYTTATLEAYLNSAGLVSNATHVAITANSNVNVAIIANTLTLSSPLATTSGGTGTGTYAVGDLLVGNSSNSLTKLAAGSDGYVLQINGAGVVAWNTLDGGVF